MRDLIERLERATGPDRELDAAIIFALYPGAQVNQYCVGDTEPVVFHAEPLVPNKHDLPEFTKSLDAALTLVPDGWMWDVSSSGCAWIMRNDDSICDSQIVIGGIESPAIALCIAALRAREDAK